MTADDFLQTATMLRVRPDAYSLQDVRDECYVLEAAGGSWRVYYSERGLQTDVRDFTAEKAALSDLLERLRADPSTHMASS